MNPESGISRNGNFSIPVDSFSAPPISPSGAPSPTVRRTRNCLGPRFGRCSLSGTGATATLAQGCGASATAGENPGSSETTVTSADAFSPAKAWTLRKPDGRMSTTGLTVAFTWREDRGAAGSSLRTSALLEIAPWNPFVSMTRVIRPFWPGPITRSYSAAVHPHDGRTSVRWRSVVPSLRTTKTCRMISPLATTPALHVGSGTTRCEAAAAGPARKARRIGTIRRELFIWLPPVGRGNGRQGDEDRPDEVVNLDQSGAAFRPGYYVAEPILFPSGPEAPFRADGRRRAAAAREGVSGHSGKGDDEVPARVLGVHPEHFLVPDRESPGAPSRRRDDEPGASPRHRLPLAA